MFPRPLFPFLLWLTNFCRDLTATFYRTKFSQELPIKCAKIGCNQPRVISNVLASWRPMKLRLLTINWHNGKESKTYSAENQLAQESPVCRTSSDMYIIYGTHLTVLTMMRLQTTMISGNIMIILCIVYVSSLESNYKSNTLSPFSESQILHVNCKCSYCSRHPFDRNLFKFTFSS